VIAESLEQPILSPTELDRASADPKRVNLEVKRFKRDPDGYIEKNHRRLSEWDFPVFAANNVRIIDKNGRNVPLVFNRVQRRLWRWFLEDLASGQPLRWYVVKARQMGCSTWVLALFYWLTGSRPNRNALVVTQDEASVNNFNSRFRSIHAQSHPLLKSPTITDRRDLVHFGTETYGRKRGDGVGLDSRVVFTTASHGELGRSYNFHAVLLSEFAIWPEMKIDAIGQLASLNQAIADLPGTVVILETTAKGQNEATKMYLDKENGYRKIFIPHVAYDEYRRPPRRPLGDLCASDEAGGRSTRYGNEIAEARLIEDALHIWYQEEVEAGGEEWIEAEVQARLNWRRYTIDKKCNGDLLTFRREYPTIAAHAFSATGKHCFDTDSIEEMRAHVATENLTVQRFSYIHDPESTDANLKFQANPYGQLHVYRLPEAGRMYVLAGDPGQGIPNSGDPSALVVLDVTDGLEEAASYNEIVTPDKFAEMAYYLGLIYNSALLGVEDNEKGGFAANLILKRMSYPRLYYRFDDYDKKATLKPGFHTNDTKKSVLVSHMQQLIRDHEVLFRTEQIHDQLEHYMLLPDGKMGGAQGWNDDLVSASLIAVHLSTKVHLFPARVPPPAKGTAAYAFNRHLKSKRPGAYR
jgi:hypothetical protein